MSKHDQLGTRMKSFYEEPKQSYLERRTYTIIRLDGKAFHTYTKNFKKPFDQDLMDAMSSTAKYLLENIQGAKIAYTQSDEISLLLTDFDTLTTESWFNGNVQKIVSVSASLATAYFNNYYKISNLNINKLAFFDSRVFTVPHYIEVENYFIWRQQDCIRNSINAVAQSLMPTKEIYKKSTFELLSILKEKYNIDYKNDYSFQEQFGTFFVRPYVKVQEPLIGNLKILDNRNVFSKYIPRHYQ